MKRLALDTSTSTLSLSLFQEEDLIASEMSNITKQHGEHLLVHVAQLLDWAHWSADQLDAIYLGIGPGSYTGLRIGTTMAKVWAKNSGCSLFTCSSLALMAGQLFDPSEEFILVPLMDARRGTAYTGAYQWQKDHLVNLLPDQHVDWQDWLERSLCPYLKRLSKPKHLVFITADDGELVQHGMDLFEGLATYSLVTGFQAWPDTRYALQVPNQEIRDIDTLTPFYAHLTLAEQEWAQKNSEKIDQNERYVEQTNETSLS